MLFFFFPAVLIFHQKIKEKNAVTVSFPIFFPFQFLLAKGYKRYFGSLSHFFQVFNFQLPDANLGSSVGNSNTLQALRGYLHPSAPGHQHTAAFHRIYVDLGIPEPPSPSTEEICPNACPRHYLHFLPCCILDHEHPLAPLAQHRAAGL